jgi:hypothetical protein
MNEKAREMSVEGIEMTVVKGNQDEVSHCYEAYVCILFSSPASSDSASAGSEKLHQAVVQSDNEQFQMVVTTVLQSIQ